MGEISSGVTWRAALIGSSLSILLAFLTVTEQALGGGWGLTDYGFGEGALFLFFSLICGIGLLRRMGVVRSGLRPGELLVVFSMLLMASAVKGVIPYLLPHLIGFVYYATPENGWRSHVIPLLPDGLVIKDSAAAKGFFEGLGSEGEIPYRAWAGPLCAWAVLLGAFCFTMMSLMVILRKRWMEQERLSFPLAQLPALLVEGEADERPLLDNGIFWFGFAVPALIGLTVIVHEFLPFIPAIHLYFYTRFYRNSIGLLIYAHFLVLGLSYLVSLDVLASILLFTLISYVQIYLIVASGNVILGSPSHIAGSYEVLGALVVLVGFGLYEARHHLRDVFRKAFASAPEVDDGDEMLSYRAAVVGSMTGLGFICCWLYMTGISAWAVPIFVGVMLVTFLGVTRVLVEAGAVMYALLSSIQVLVKSAGAQVLGGATIAGFFLAQPWSFPDGSHVMASASTTLKLRHRRGLRSRPLFYVLFLALLGGGAAAAGTLLHDVYTLGAFGFAYSGIVVGSLTSKLIYYGGAIVEPASVSQPVSLLWSGIGAAATGLLILARQRFFWWPIHPIGCAVGMISPSWWVNVLAAWLIKRNVLKYGGPSLYGRTRPLFLGLILGQAVVTGVGSIVTILTGRV